VPANLRTSIERNLSDPKINRSNQESPVHYGTLIAPPIGPTPSQSASRRPIPYVRDSFRRGRDFATAQQIQAETLRWRVEVVGRRPSRQLSGHRRAAGRPSEVLISMLDELSAPRGTDFARAMGLMATR
jgi:hypothetical protein